LKSALAWDRPAASRSDSIFKKVISMTKKTPAEQIAQHIKDAENSIAKAEVIADATGISFDFSLTYGMGGSYNPKPLTKAAALKLVENGVELPEAAMANIKEALARTDEEEAERDEDDWDESGYGWMASSQMC
jgi:hypothetical protein